MNTAPRVSVLEIVVHSLSPDAPGQVVIRGQASYTVTEPTTLYHVGSAPVTDIFSVNCAIAVVPVTRLLLTEHAYKQALQYVASTKATVRQALMAQQDAIIKMERELIALREQVRVPSHADPSSWRSQLSTSPTEETPNNALTLNSSIEVEQLVNSLNDLRGEHR